MSEHDLSQWFSVKSLRKKIVIKILEIKKQWRIYTMQLPKQKMGFLILIISLSSKQAVNVV